LKALRELQKKAKAKTEVENKKGGLLASAGDIVHQ
jgi:hypothetical protein